MDIVKALEHGGDKGLWPRQGWSVNGNAYEGIIWPQALGTKPSLADLEREDADYRANPPPPPKTEAEKLLDALAAEGVISAAASDAVAARLVSAR